MAQLRYVILLVFLSIPSFAQISLTGRVVDEAKILSNAQKIALENVLAAHEKSTTDQIVVLTVTSLGGLSIEEFGNQQGRSWGIGTKEKNNGVLLIVAPNEREVRIEVGYGLEDTLTDARTKIIIERSMIPYFRQGQIDQGIMQGTYAVLKILGADINATDPGENPNDSLNPWVVIIFFGLIGLFLFISRYFGGRGRGPRPPFMGGGFRSGGSASGGFSGGGGSFGGGGSSGRW